MRSTKRNKIAPKCAKKLIFIDNNLCLLSRKALQYKQWETRIRNVDSDAFNSFEDDGVLEVANFLFDEPDMKSTD